MTVVGTGEGYVDCYVDIGGTLSNRKVCVTDSNNAISNCHYITVNQLLFAKPYYLW
jgi:hypothetical protein